MAWSVSGRLPNTPSTGAPTSSIRSIVSLPEVDAAPWFHAVPAAVLGDKVQYVRVDRRRLYARWALLVLTFGALIGLTIARYVGSDELKSGVTLSRNTEPLSLEKQDVANATCPCQGNLLPWQNIIFLNPKLQRLADISTRDFSFAQCYSFLIRNDTKLVSSTNLTDIAEEYESHLTNLTSDHEKIQANTALAAELGMCGIIMQSILMDLPTSPRTAPRDSNYLNGFVSPYLATQDYVSASWTSYTKNLIRSQRMSNLIAYTAITQTTRGQPEVLEINGVNVNATWLTYDETYGVAYNISEAAFDNSVLYYKTFYGRIFAFMQQNSAVDWDTYKRACKPQFCDIFKTKSVMFRLTEFLGLVGGLWTTVIAFAMTFWWLSNLASFLGPGEDFYKIWHP